MAVKDILVYLETNNGKHPLDVLVANLRSTGYPEAEIQAALSGWHGSRATGVPAAMGGVEASGGSRVKGFLMAGAVIIGVDAAASLFLAIFGFWLPLPGDLLPVGAGIGAAYLLYRRNLERAPRYAGGIQAAMIIVGGIALFLSFTGNLFRYFYWYF